MPQPATVTLPLRVLHLTAGSDAGGISRYIFDLCSAMAADGHRVSVAGERGAWHCLFESAPFGWIDAPLKGGPLALHGAAKTIREQLSAGPPVDVLHVHYRRAALVGRRLQKLLALHRPPMLYTLHLSDMPLHWPLKLLSDFGDHTHVATAHSRQWLMRAAQVPAERITLIPHGIDPQKFPMGNDATRAAARRQLQLEADQTVATYVGRLDVPKNEDWLADLAAAAQSRIPRLVLLIVGEGPHERQLRRQIQAMHLQDRVRLLGPRTDVVPIYHASDLLLLPSAREGFSLVTAEAMSCGLPVLRTHTAGADELIRQNITGRSTPIDRAAFIAAALAMLADPAPLRQMGVAAAAHIRQHFTFDRQLRDTLALYRRLSGRVAS